MISVLACKDTLSFSSFSNVAFRWTCQPTRHNGPGETGAPQQRRPPWQVQQLGPRVHGQPIHHFHRRWWWWLGGWVGGWWCKLAVNSSFFLAYWNKLVIYLDTSGIWHQNMGAFFYAHVDPRTRVDDQRYFQPKKTVQSIHENVSKKTMHCYIYNP